MSHLAGREFDQMDSGMVPATQGQHLIVRQSLQTVKGRAGRRLDDDERRELAATGQQFANVFLPKKGATPLQELSRRCVILVGLAREVE